MRKNALRIQSSFFARFFEFAEGRYTRKRVRFEKTRFGLFWGGKKNWLEDHSSRPREPHSGINEALNGLKCSGSCTEATETLGKLLA